ncbi:hypothetical protein C483_11543 [Natrialba hulunbeirensis JCM 10989]|uniref:Halobacterial output domain-containing protein n=1 Tax=Natrialba hulunbeirensis JCM 10989 TaxID=1227493 RepID=L9ZVP2_9EURY|nr:HalOD1 output domain-containing protein [Natrialba hulunbeirensis]ELY90141.1 hypothetical protein C483_11543 [Natrialba hulunbeirensis JCM 10989]
MPSSDDTCDGDLEDQESADEPDQRTHSGAETDVQSEPHSDADSNPNSNPLEYTTNFDPITDSASERVVVTIAALTDTRPAELPALAHIIDPDALDRVFEHAATKADAGEQEVWFTYAEFDVGLHSTGTLTVRSATGSATSTDTDTDETDTATA